MPSAAITEGRDVPFDAAPAFGADISAYAGLFFDINLAGGAFLGANQFRQALYEAL